MRSPVWRYAGLTLVELLVSLSIVGVLLTAIIALSSNILAYSNRVDTINERLADLSDAAGYVAMNVRQSMGVLGTPGNPVTITADGSSFSCSTDSTDGACVALIVPRVDRGSTTAIIDGFDLVAFRVAELDEWAGDPGVREGWNGTDTPLMLEYRTDVCPGCSTPPDPASISSVTSDTTSLVITDLVYPSPITATTQPFLVNGSNTVVTLRMRTRGVGTQVETFVPNDAALETRVLRRP